MSELTVPQIDFSSLGQLPQIWKQGQQDALRQQTLANLGQGGQVDANTLLRSGDLSLAQLGINLQNKQGEDAWRREEAARAQGNADRSYGLQVKQFNAGQDPTPDNFVKDPAAPGGYRGIGPADPEYQAKLTEAKTKAELAAGGGKPIPYETLGGTKFLMPKPGGGYISVDPSAVGVPAQQPQPSPQQPQPFPAQGAAPFNPNGAQAQPPAAAPAVPAAAQADLEAVDPQTGRREGYLQNLDPQVRDYVKKVADYEIDPRTTSVKGGMREKLMSAVAKYDPTYNQNDFGARAKAIKDFSTGPQGNIVRSFDVAIDHLDTLDKAAKAMQNGDVRLLNELRNKWREQTGSDLPTNFNALKPLVSGEIAKAVIGSNNALADREELRAPLNAAGSPEQISGVIGGYKALMGGQIKGLKKQYEETTGKKDFDKRIRETTRKALLGDGKDSGGGNVTSSGVKWSVE